MKKSLKVFKFSLLTALVLGTVIPGTTASASESNNEEQAQLFIVGGHGSTQVLPFQQAY